MKISKNENKKIGLQLLLNIFNEQIHLASYFAINVKIAALVLSSTVNGVLREYVSPDNARASTFSLMLHQFFDTMNV